MEEKVSVIIPLYNHEKYIGFAIDGVLNQTYENIEIIIIDDGSVDSSYDKALEYKNKYPERINLFSRENKGAHNTINEGISLATGEYIAILNSDDIFKNEKIERCVDLIDKKQADIIFGGVEFIDANNRIIKNGIPVDWQIRGLKFLEDSNLFPLSMLNENIISTTSNMFFRKSIIDGNIKFYSLRYCHDLDFILSCVKNHKYYFDNSKKHISYRCHDSNTIKEDLRKIQLEIAAVISTVLVDFRSSIIDKKIENIKYLAEFLKNKNLSNLIVYLMMKYIERNSKEDFYEYIHQKEIAVELYNLLS